MFENTLEGIRVILEVTYFWEVDILKNELILFLHCYILLSKVLVRHSWFKEGIIGILIGISLNFN